MFSNRSKRLQLVINVTFINLICRSGSRSWVIKKSTPTNCFHITTAAWTGASIQDEQISFKTKTIRSCYSSLPHRDTGKINTFHPYLGCFQTSKHLFKVKIWFQNRRMKWKRSKKMKEDGKSETSLNNSNSSEDLQREEATNEISSESEDVKIENTN